MDSKCARTCGVVHLKAREGVDAMAHPKHAKEKKTLTPFPYAKEKRTLTPFPHGIDT